MELILDPNIRQIYADIQGMKIEYADDPGLEVYYRYLIRNQELINKAFESFWVNADDETLSGLSKMQGSYVSGKFFNKKVVKSYFEMEFISLTNNLRLLKFGLGPKDSYKIEDKMTQAYLTLGAIMHFSNTNHLQPDRTLLLTELARKYKKTISVSKIESNTLSVTIEGGLIEGENEGQFKKIDFSFSSNRLSFEAEAEIPGYNSWTIGYVSLFEKPFRRLIHYPPELEKDLLHAFRVQGFTIHE